MINTLKVTMKKLLLLFLLISLQSAFAVKTPKGKENEPPHTQNSAQKTAHNNPKKRKKLSLSLKCFVPEKTFDVDELDSPLVKCMNHMLGNRRGDEFDILISKIKAGLKARACYYNALVENGEGNRAGRFLGEQVVPLVSLFSYSNKDLHARCQQRLGSAAKRQVKFAIKKLSEFSDDNFLKLMDSGK